MDSSLETFIRKIPKIELHLHIEGTFEPELMFEIAKRNNIKIKFDSVEEIRAAYQFSNLQDFLDIYYEGAGVLIHEKDFYDLTWNYLKQMHLENVVHTEIFFDPQTHTHRGITFETVIRGIHRALEDAKSQLGITSRLIMCFLRHLTEEDAFRTLEEALPFKSWITGVGLDSSEKGNPPSKFKRVFEKCIEHGFITMAHAGEEGPAEYVREAIDLLDITRIDHGNNSLNDEELVKELARKQIPLTVCPLSNLKLRVVNTLEEHPLKKMMDKNLLVTVNSDDPAYFGGYLTENFLATQKALSLNREDIRLLALNAVKASLLDEPEKEKITAEIEDFYLNN